MYNKFKKHFNNVIKNKGVFIMKKIKKILSAVSAAILYSVLMANTAAVNAAESEIINTYRVYFDVNANSGVASAYYGMTFSKKMSAASFEVGTLGGRVGSGGNGQGTNQTCGCFYTASETVIDPGTLFTMKFYGSLSFEEAVSEYELTAKYKDGVEMLPNPISMDVVLVGDANDDGFIDISDAVSIECYIANPSGYPINNLRAADVNGDGVITADDSKMIQEYRIKLIEHF